MNKLKYISGIIFVYSLIAGCGSNPTINEYISEGDTNESLKYINSGGDINVSNSHGITPLHTAAKKGDIKVLNALLARGANVNRKVGSLTMSPIQFAAFNNNAAVTKLLISKGARINANDNQGRTALKIASKLGNSNVVKALLAGGAKINQMQNLSSTALIEAVSAKKQETVSLLLHHGANINATDEKGNTPLIIAAFKGHEAIFNILLNNGADISLSNAEGQNALIIGAFIENKSIVDLLLNKGVNVHTKTKYGRSALHIAASSANKDLVNTLLNSDAKPLIIDSSEDDYFATAFSHGMYAEWLINKGHIDNSKQTLGITIKYFQKAIDEYKKITKDLDSKITTQNIKTIALLVFSAYATQTQARINAKASGTGRGFAYNTVKIKGTGTLSDTRDSYVSKDKKSALLKNKYSSIYNCVLTNTKASKCINDNKGI